MSDEEYVRSKYTPDHFHEPWLSKFMKQCGGYDNMWRVLKIHLDTRLKNISNLTEEIRYMDIGIKGLDEGCGDEVCGCTEPAKRIKSRLQDLLHGSKYGLV